MLYFIHLFVLIFISLLVGFNISYAAWYLLFRRGDA